MAFVAELLREPAGIEVRASRAVLVNGAAVGELRPALFIERGERTVGGVLKDGAEEVVGICGAARDVDDVLPFSRRGLATRR